jgi:5-methylcytosine-specific restriction endonuclease McrA
MPTRPQTHRPAGPAKRADTRLTAQQRGYTWTWAKLARAFLAQHPLCHYCLLLGRITPAEHCDHYTKAEPGSPEWYDTDNLRPACAFHNSAKRGVPGPEYERLILATRTK